MAYVTPDKYSPYPRVCDICGKLRSINTMRKLDGITWVCDKHTGERTRIMLDLLNAQARPPQTWPNLNAKPQNPEYPNSLEPDEGAAFAFIDRQVQARCRFELVISGAAAFPSAGGAVPAMAWSARYLYNLIQQGTRTTMLARARVLLAQAADFLLSRQYGSLTGPSPSSTRATDAFFGGVLESGALVFVTDDVALSGLALLYAYRIFGTTKYRDGARAAASYLRNVQAIGSNGSHYTSSDAGGTARLYTGSLASQVATASGFYSNSLFYPSALSALEFWNELKTTDGDQSVGATAAVTGFSTTPAQLMSTSMADLRVCWANGIRDTDGDTINGFSSTTPREVFNAYPAAKPQFTSVVGSGMWEYADGNASVGTQLTAQNVARGLCHLYAYEGATSQATTILTWLRSFTSNATFETPANTSDSVLARSTTGTYDPTVCFSTLLTVRDSGNSYAAIAENGSSLYDWGAFGLVANLLAATNMTSFKSGRLGPLNIRQRYEDGTRNDGYYFDRIEDRGLSGLTFQTAFASDAVNSSATTASPAGTTTATVTSPPSSGLCLWTGGQGSTIHTTNDAGGDARCDGWTNLAYPVNGNLFATISGFGNGPYAGLDTLDGKPSLTWRFDIDHTQLLNLDNLAGTHVVTPMKATDGQDFGYDPGQHQARSLIVVLTPRFAAAAFNITGGTVAAWGASPYFMPLFNIDSDTLPNAFYVFASQFNWRPVIGTAKVLQGPNNAGGSGGAYDNAPMVVEWSTSGGSDLSFYINGISIPVTPTTFDTTYTAGLAWILGEQTGSGDQASRWKGTMTELLVYDFKLSSNPTARTQVYSYLAGRYPSIPLSRTNVAMTNDAVRAAQYANSYRLAH